MRGAHLVPAAAGLMFSVPLTVFNRLAVELFCASIAARSATMMSGLVLILLTSAISWMARHGIAV